MGFLIYYMFNQVRSYGWVFGGQGENVSAATGGKVNILNEVI